MHDGADACSADRLFHKEIDYTNSNVIAIFTSEPTAIKLLPYPRERGPMGGAKIGGWADIRGINNAFIYKRAPR